MDVAGGAGVPARLPGDDAGGPAAVHLDLEQRREGALELVGRDGLAVAGPARETIADADGTGVVDFSDLLIVRTDFGCMSSEPPCEGGVDLSGRVDFDDRLLTLAAWGPLHGTAGTPRGTGRT